MVTRENEIEDAIIADPAAIGFPGAEVIRNARVSRDTGRVDLMILPKSGSTKLALVEAKRARAPDAASKVVGQLVMYYTAALQIGTAGLSRIREFAISKPRLARATGNTSLNQLAGGASSQDEAWTTLQTGRKLRSNDLRLFLALDAEPRPKLVRILRLLAQHHKLEISVVIADGRGVRVFQY